MWSIARTVLVPVIAMLTLFALFYQSQIAYKSEDLAQRKKQVESLTTGTLIRDVRKMPQIHLVDDNNFETKSSFFEGQWSIFFFGYATCPDFCPKILSKLDAVGRFIPDEHLKKYFVSINPEHDTPEVMRQFLTAFSHHIHGLTGPREDIFSLIDFFKLTAAQAPDYSGHIEHSASLVLLSPEGKMCGIFNQIDDTKKLAEDIGYIQRTL